MSDLELLTEMPLIDGWRLRVVECPHRGRWMLVAPDDEDRWWTIGMGQGEDDLLDVAAEQVVESYGDEEDLLGELVEKGTALFGVPWEALSDRGCATQIHAYAAAEPWFVEEFTQASADELRALRDAVPGSISGVVEAMRVVRSYRLNVNRPAPRVDR